MRLANGKIETKWYRKSIASNRYLNFQSNNPMTHKRNVITAITDRAIRFTNPRDRPKSIAKVKEWMNENGYPNDFVSKIIENRVNRFYNEKGQHETKEKNSSLHNMLPAYRNVWRKHWAITTSTSAAKQPTPLVILVHWCNKSKVIYEVKCDQCNTVYVGMTKQKLKDRMSKHKSDVTSEEAERNHRPNITRSNQKAHIRLQRREDSGPHT